MPTNRQISLFVSRKAMWTWSLARMMSQSTKSLSRGTIGLVAFRIVPQAKGFARASLAAEDRRASALAEGRLDTPPRLSRETTDRGP